MCILTRSCVRGLLPWTLKSSVTTFLLNQLILSLFLGGGAARGGGAGGRGPRMSAGQELGALSPLEEWGRLTSPGGLGRAWRSRGDRSVVAKMPHPGGAKASGSRWTREKHLPESRPRLRPQGPLELVKKDFIGPGLHLRPVHADHARPPLQWTLNSVFSAYGDANRRIRPLLDRP